MKYFRFEKNFLIHSPGMLEFWILVFVPGISFTASSEYSSSVIDAPSIFNSRVKFQTVQTKSGKKLTNSVGSSFSSEVEDFVLISCVSSVT